MTEFVQKHLFGGELSPPLTRSGIHDASQTQIIFSRYVCVYKQMK